MEIKTYNDVFNKIESTLLQFNSPLYIDIINYIINICETNNAIEIEIIDTGWDISEYPNRQNHKIDTSKFNIIQDFLDYPNGNQIATYISGHGFFAETYSENITRFIDEYIFNWIKLNNYNQLVMDDDDDCSDIKSEFFDLLYANEPNNLNTFFELISIQQFPKRGLNEI